MRVIETFTKRHDGLVVCARKKAEANIDGKTEMELLATLMFGEKDNKKDNSLNWWWAPSSRLGVMPCIRSKNDFGENVQIECRVYLQDVPEGVFTVGGHING